MAGKIGDKESFEMLCMVFLIFGGLAAILIAIFVGIYLSHIGSPQKDFSIMFADDLSFNDDDRATWLINNQDRNYEKLLLVYRTSDSSVPDIIKSSDLVDDSGKSIESDNIRFNGQPVYSSNFIAGWNSIKITFTDHSLLPGSFEGRILVGGGIPESIPITISTKPLLTEAILLVIIGALISVCIWELARHLKNKARNKQTSEFKDALDNTKLQLDDTQKSNITAQMNVNQVELLKEKVRNNSPGVTIPKIAIAELFSALLGIVIALFGVLYNENVTGVQVLDAYQVLVLAGIGLAAGSLKELVDKY